MSKDLLEKLGEEGIVFAKNNIEQFFRILDLLAKESETKWDDIALGLIKEEAIKKVKEW